MGKRVKGWGFCRALRFVVASLLLPGIWGVAGAQTTAGSTSPTAEAGQAGPVAPASLAAWKGLRVVKVEFQGVIFDAKDPLPRELPQQAGEPLDPAKVTASLRRLFTTGRYRDISVAGRREGGGAVLIYVGTPRYFVGRVTIAGVKEERLASLLEYATKLQPGSEFTGAMIAAGTDGVRQALENSGYFQAKITPKTTLDETDKQVNATYTVSIGPQARVGLITLEGKDPGLTVAEVRKKGKLKQGSKVNRDTVSNALTRLRSQYEKEDRLEATTSLRLQTYNEPRRQLDYDFSANQGPVVKVEVVGASLSKSRLKLLVPIYQEGTIDNDLLNEGTSNIKDFLSQEGYFDATVAVKLVGAGTGSESVVYSVNKGVKHKVGSVTIVGNKYFDTDLLKERMQVQKSDV